MDLELYQKLMHVADRKILKLRFDHADGYFYEYYQNHKSMPIIADLDKMAVRDTISEAIQAAINYFSEKGKTNKYNKTWDTIRNPDYNPFNFSKDEGRYRFSNRKRF